MTTDILNSVAAGYTAGVCGVVVGHPMDSAKVWLQTAVSESRPTSKPVSASVSNLASSSTSTSPSTPSTLPLSPRPLGPMSSVVARSYATIAARAAASDTSATASKRGMSTIASRYSALAAMSSSGTVAARIPPHSTRRMTLRALYAGVSGPLVTVGWVQSLNFCIYDTLRRTLHQQDNQNNQNNDQYSLRTIVISSGTSGAVISFVTNPLLVLKTKQQLMTWGFRRALQDTLRSGNSARLSLSGFYTGFSCHFLYESVGRGLYVGSYECFKQWMSNYNNKTTNADQGHVSLTIPQRMMSAGAAGTVSCAVMFPFDALRSRLIASSLSCSSPTMAAREGVAASAQGAIAMGRQMLQEGGIRSFYRGFGVTIIRSGPVAAAVLPIYDVTLEWLNQQP